MTWDKKGNIRGPIGPAGVAGAPGKAFAIRGPYDENTYYKSGDVVTHDGRAWVVDPDRHADLFTVVANPDGSFDVSWNVTSPDPNAYFFLQYTANGDNWGVTYGSGNFYQDSRGRPDPVHIDPLPNPANLKPVYFRSVLLGPSGDLSPLQVIKVMDARHPTDPDPSVSLIGTPALPDVRGSGWLMVGDRGAQGEQGPMGLTGPLPFEIFGTYNDVQQYRSDDPVSAVYFEGSTYALKANGTGVRYSNAVANGGLSIIVNFFASGVPTFTGWEWDWRDGFDTAAWTRQASVAKPANATTASTTFTARTDQSLVWVRSRLVRSDGTKTPWTVQTVTPTAAQTNTNLNPFLVFAGTPSSTSTEWTLVAAGGAQGVAGVAGAAGAAGPAGAGVLARGAWTVGTSYAVNDLVTYNGSTWRTKVAHTASTTGVTAAPAATGATAANWELFAAGGAGGDNFYGFTVNRASAIVTQTVIAPGSGTVIEFDKYDSWFFASPGATLAWSTTRPANIVLTADLPNYQWVDQQITASLLAFSSAQKTAADLSTQLLLMGV